MTDKEIQQQVAQAEQDNITLDFSKWSFQQSQAKLDNSHSLWLVEKERVLAHQRADNAEIRRKYLAGLEEKKAAKQREDDAAIDAELANEKRRLQNEWLANNPSFTADDFERKAWVLLRENLLEERRTAALNAEIEACRASGRYSL
jgi:hypothetical protein